MQYYAKELDKNMLLSIRNLAFSQIKGNKTTMEALTQFLITQ